MAVDVFKIKEEKEISVAFVVLIFIFTWIKTFVIILHNGSTFISSAVLLIQVLIKVI